jgi:hypothetical protein
VQVSQIVLKLNTVVLKLFEFMKIHGEENTYTDQMLNFSKYFGWVTSGLSDMSDWSCRCLSIWFVYNRVQVSQIVFEIEYCTLVLKLFEFMKILGRML